MLLVDDKNHLKGWGYQLGRYMLKSKSWSCGYINGTPYTSHLVPLKSKYKTHLKQ